jgi:large subunit ribosomal protein L29
MTARAVALDSLRSLSAEELALHLREQRGQLFQVRLQQTIGQVENHRQIRAIRKELARAMTVQVETRLAAERGEPAPAPRPAAVAAAAKAKAKARPSRRRAPAAAAAGSPDAPVEEAISDVAVERVEPEAATTPATPAKRRPRKATPAAADDAAAATAETEHNHDEDEP